VSRQVCELATLQLTRQVPHLWTPRHRRLRVSCARHRAPHRWAQCGGRRSGAGWEPHQATGAGTTAVCGHAPFCACAALQAPPPHMDQGGGLQRCRQGCWGALHLQHRAAASHIDPSVHVCKTWDGGGCWPPPPVCEALAVVRSSTRELAATWHWGVNDSTGEYQAACLTLTLHLSATSAVPTPAPGLGIKHPRPEASTA